MNLKKVMPLRKKERIKIRFKDLTRKEEKARKIKKVKERPKQINKSKKENLLILPQKVAQILNQELKDKIKQEKKLQLQLIVNKDIFLKNHKNLEK